MKFISFIGGSVAAVLVFTTAVAGGSSEDAWKGLVMRALAMASMKDYSHAEQVFGMALHEAEHFGPDDARIGTTYNSLGLVYRAENKWPEAETAYRKALTILEKSYGVDSIDVGNVDFNIATVMFDQGHEAMAMPFLQKSQAVYEKMLGGSSLKTASVLCMIGDAQRASKNFKEAEGPLRRCADIRETDGGMQNPDLADALFSLAMTYKAEGNYALAEPRFMLAEKIRENTLGLTSPLLAQTMEEHAEVLKLLGRDKDAARLAVISGAIRRNVRKEK